MPHPFNGIHTLRFDGCRSSPPKGFSWWYFFYSLVCLVTGRFSWQFWWREITSLCHSSYVLMLEVRSKYCTSFCVSFVAVSQAGGGGGVWGWGGSKRRPLSLPVTGSKKMSGLNRVNSLTIIIFLFLRYHTGIVTSSKTVITEENGLKRSPENLYPMLVSGWILRITVTVILLRVWRGT